MTRANKRKRWDVERVRAAIGAPDPGQTFTAAARIEDPTDAIHFDPQSGWIVDVSFYGGPLDGEKEVPVRVLSKGPGGDGFGEYIPPARGAEVLIGIPEGDVEANPVMIGYLTNEDGDKPPTQINGLALATEAPASTPLAVSPHDTEIKRSPHNRREQYDGARTVQATSHVLKADQPTAGVLLGSETAAKSFLLGEDLVTNLIAVVDQLLILVQTGGNSGGPVVLAGLVAFQEFWNTPITGLKAQLQQPGVVLSVKVKGE